MSSPGTTSPLPHLNTPRIAALAGSWEDGGLWADTLWLSRRFWDADPADQTVAWHHLVLAVGNWKRQRGRRLRPAPLTMSVPELSPRSSFTMPVEGLFDATVHRDDPESWAAMADALPGAAVPTASTLLAALWPDHP